jgi:hypothetical protein
VWRLVESKTLARYESSPPADGDATRQSDSAAFLLLLETYSTRLLAQAFSEKYGT